MSEVPDTCRSTPSTRWATCGCVLEELVDGAGGSEPVADKLWGGLKGLTWVSIDRLDEGSVVDNCWTILVVADDDRG
jgi:hypothetical protein